MTVLTNDAPRTDVCYKKVSELMKDISNRLYAKDSEAEKKYLPKVIHDCLQDQYDLGGMRHPREIFLPLQKELWSPYWQNFYDEHPLDPGLPWPQYSTYFYVNAALFLSEPQPDVYSGYALYENDLVPCSFFTYMTMTEHEVNGQKIDMPEIFAIDPMSVRLGKQPDCYIGISMPHAYLEEWCMAGFRGKHPLAIACEKLTQERMPRY